MSEKELLNSSGIYYIKNIINGKMYIGYAKNIRKRWNYHKMELRLNIHPNEKLQNAWNLYKEDNFLFEVAELCEIFELPRREHHWATIFYTCDRDKGYNIRPTDPEDIKKVSEETRKKISLYHKGKPKSEEHKRKIGKGNKGKIISQAQIDYSRKIQTGRKLSEERKQKISKFQKGKKVSDLTKKKISINMENRKNIFKICEKCGKNVNIINYYFKHGKQCDKKIVHSIETKDKISKTRKGKAQNNTQKEVIQLDINKNYIEEFKSIKEAVEKTMVHPSTISKHLKAVKNKIKYQSSKTKYFWILKKDYIK